MALDQWAFRAAPEEVEKAKSGVAPRVTRIAHWRKHPGLQGWMENLWRKRASDPSPFNGQDVFLSEQDLIELRRDVIDGVLPETTGLFFGSNSDEVYREADLRFITQALAALEEGDVVVYTSWW